jgi:hypothetical protein
MLYDRPQCRATTAAHTNFYELTTYEGVVDLAQAYNKAVTSRVQIPSLDGVIDANVFI